MSPNLEPIIKQVSLVGGQPRSIAPNLATIVMPSGRGPSRGLLAVLVDLSGPAERRDAQAERLVEAAQTAYLAASSSLTLSLRRAVEAANHVLYESNLNRARDYRCSGGIACVAVVADDAYIAHAGPVRVYASQAGEIRRYPPPVAALDEIVGVPLGVRPDLAVNLFRAHLEPGDTVLLASAALDHLVTEDQLGALLVEQDVPLPEALAVLPGVHDLSALALSIPAAEGTQKRRGEHVTPAPPPSRLPAPQPAVSALAAPFETEDDDRGWEEIEPESGLLHQSLEAAVSVLSGMGRGLRRLNVGRRLSWGASVLAVGLQRLLPDPDNSLDLDGERQRRRVWLGLAITFPILVAVLTVVMYLQNQSRFDGLLSQAREHQARLLVMGSNRSAQIGALRDLEATLTQALALRPSNPEVLGMYSQVQSMLDQIAGVVRLEGLQPLVRLPTESRPRQLWVYADTVYMLDPSAGQVYRYAMSPSAGGQVPSLAVLLRAGQVPGGGKPIDLVGLSSLDNPAPVGTGVLLDSGTLLRYTTSDNPVVWPVVASDTWQSPAAVATFDGNLYILDSGRDQIYKYVPVGEGYTAAPTLWIQGQVSLTTAVDMAIDGMIYVILNDGTLLRFIAGKPEPFDLIALDEPLRNPVAIFTTPSSKSLFIADAGNQRIVQVGKDRLFQRQFRPRRGSSAFAKLQDIFIDEARGILFALSENVLYAARLAGD